ncbi:alpha/beta fold hydrolase [Agromyces larvae]|uniref:Alpha/beta hydrolase n=1 Tax=Agromyces larvae TaxID=2929802 RepID=A0ABY4C1C4_9MICO|nr:alpha/beta hydrolase [Agromyces larvae]UOE44994.1 alpha/beta hydrolase [Agromyces larvae]
MTSSPAASEATRADAPVADPFAELRFVDAGALRVGYLDAGPRDGTPVLLLHGWPYDIRSFAEVVPLLTERGYRVLVPYLRGHGSTRFRDEHAPRNAQQSVLAADAIDFLDAVGVERAIVAGFDWGARTADILTVLHPGRIIGLVSVSGYLIGSRAAGATPLPPAAELQWWYQFYFATERGRQGYDRYRRDFAKLIWRLASPQWSFDDAEFDASAVAFDNPDHVDIVIHNYRWRLGLAAGDPRFDEVETILATAPTVGVPTITLEGDANGAPHPDAAAYAPKFTAAYEHRVVGGGVGHNLPQEAPREFARAIVDVHRMSRQP